MLFCSKPAGVGDLGGSVSQASDFGSGHDHVVHAFEPRVGLSVLTAQSLEPLSDSVSPSLPARLSLGLCLSLSLKNKQTYDHKRGPTNTMFSRITSQTGGQEGPVLQKQKCDPVGAGPTERGGGVSSGRGSVMCLVPWAPLVMHVDPFLE